MTQVPIQKLKERLDKLNKGVSSIETEIVGLERELTKLRNDRIATLGALQSLQQIITDAEAEAKATTAPAEASA